MDYRFDQGNISRKTEKIIVLMRHLCKTMPIEIISVLPSVKGAMANATASSRRKSNLMTQLNFLCRLERAFFQDSDDSARLHFNVIGCHYEVPVSLLNNYPTTLLGEPTLRAQYYNYRTDEFIFDRHPHAFESIITFYQSDGDSLAKPHGMPTEVFYEELKFFRLPSSLLIAYYDREIAPMVHIEVVPRDRSKRYVWLLLKYGMHDWKSQAMRTFDFLLNLIALWTFARDCVGDHRLTQILYWIEESNGKVLRPVYMLLHLHMSTMTIELVCTIIFIIQACARVHLAPTLHQIYSDPCFWFDLLSILPNLAMYLLVEIQRQKNTSLPACFTVVSFLRSWRILRFARQIPVLPVFLRSLVYSMREWFHLTIILIGIILFFGELVYLVEEWTSDSPVRTVMDGYWLTALTVTSLGYGDLYPTRRYSRMIMSLCSIIGLVLIAMPLPGLYHRFDRLYRAEKSKRQIIRYVSSDQTALRI